MGHTTNDTLSSGIANVRIKPRLLIGIALYIGYLAVFFAFWVVNEVEYTSIGNSLESTKLHYAYPTLAGSLFLAIAISLLGWWRPVFFDNNKSGPKWALILPIAMLVLSGLMFATMNIENATAQLVMWSLFGALGVGFGEEVVTRGTLIVSLRSKFSEVKVWFWSTLLFAALHIPNAFFGVPWESVPVQFVMTFIMGSAFYAVRRLTGTLIWPLVLHGLWDSAVFLPRATGVEGSLMAFLVYPIAITLAIVVIRRNRNVGRAA